MYYETKLKAVVLQEWQEHVEELKKNLEEGEKPLPVKPDLAFRNRVIRRLYSLESEEVKAEIEEYRNDPTAAMEDDSAVAIDPGMSPEEVERVKKARLIQKYVF